MKLIVGLGNPGARYATTRHNVGRNLIACLAEEFSVSLSSQKDLLASVASLDWNEKKIVLAFPETYMNHSGRAVRALVDAYSLKPEKDLLVVVDEAALPLGRIRLRGKGSAGGHNGLKSIEAQLGTDDYARLRLGIGPENAEQGLRDVPLEAFVLSPFEPRYHSAVENMFDEGCKACKYWIVESMTKAMSIVNPSK